MEPFLRRVCTPVFVRLFVMTTIGLDLGGTTFHAACVDNAGRILSSHSYETRQNEPPELLLPRLADAASQARSSLNEDQSTLVEAIGIGVPGPVRSQEGICVYAPNLAGWRNLQVSAPIREKAGLPVALINDANAAALAEARFGAGRGIEDLLVLTLGTGVGSGLVLGGELHLGSSERGAEIGHVTVDIEAEQGSAGIAGTVESLCGRDAIVWRAVRHLASGRASLIPEICPDLSQLTPRHLSEAAEKGDEVACAVWTETAKYLAAGIMNVVLTADVARVVVGGGIAQAGEALFAPLRRAVSARTSELAFDVDEIVPAKLGPEAGVIGAAQWAREVL